MACKQIDRPGDNLLGLGVIRISEDGGEDSPTNNPCGLLSTEIIFRWMIVVIPGLRAFTEPPEYGALVVS